ncbi:MAG: hypothetical protein A2X32_12360 [Elusimicrobia bacterium GWC2_64_44]|nr:MAG: hypothetical protein A2X32_12360 [Elusimicrobia bacterium GWC2_64_44]
MPHLRDIIAGPLPEGAGAKAAGTAALAAAGFRVPSSWVLPPAAVAEFFGRGASPLAAAPLLAEAARTLKGRFPVMVRSSSSLEDLPGAAAPGVYRSELAKDLFGLAAAAARCAAAAAGPAAREYAKAKGSVLSRGMALLLQPFVEAELGAVCTLYHRQELVVELARGGAAPITSGAGARWRAVFSPDGKLRKKTGPGFPLRAAKAAAAAALRVQRALYPSSNISVEMALPSGRPVLLQARVFGAVGCAALLDFTAIYAEVEALMRGLGFAPGEWALSETPALLAQNYLGLSRPASETLEHFVVTLRPGGLARARRQRWLIVRHQGEPTLFPPGNDRRAQRELSALAKRGLLFIFREAPAACRVKRLPLPGGGSLPFTFVLSSLSANEAAFIRRRLTAEGASAMRERLERELDLLGAVLKKLRAADRSAYGRWLCAALPAQLAQLGRQRAAAAVPTRGARKAAIKGVPARREDRVVEGPAVAGRDILRAGRGRFIYAAHDFEPSFLSRIGRVAAVAISRGAVGSHAAAICAEFGVPLLVETENINRIRTGDRLRVDLATGRITVLPRR